ncbi:hypothetical protein [Mycobacteroides abscessus]|uniref:hypothetical protein n=1 Tax=Mycobacteroides abscessus TaxID=36809 RepID=UPI000C2605B2|nr:hypothetical protein [Mycobacteroides abscessus]
MTLELPPRVPEGQRPNDFASLAAEQVDLENAINELILRLEDHKYRWELYEFGLDATADPEIASRGMVDFGSGVVHAL